MSSYIVIPFYMRHSNLRKVLNSLEKQQYRDFKVKICAFQPDNELANICNKKKIDCEIIEVNGNDWNISAARNAGIKKFNKSKFKSLVLLDSDILVEEMFLSNHKLLSKPNRVIAGSVYSFAPYSAQVFSSKIELADDPRWKSRNPNVLKVKWPFCWSGNVSLCRTNSTVHIPLFDEEFKGWGAEDMEWSYRLSKLDWEIFFSMECNGYHLPHERNVEKNVFEEKRNLRYFFKKWRFYEVEVVTSLNDFGACEWFSNYPNIEKDFTLNVAEKKTNHGALLYVGFSEDDLTHKGVVNIFAKYELLGIQLPYIENQISDVVISEKYKNLPTRVLDMILSEVDRVSNKFRFESV